MSNFPISKEGFPYIIFLIVVSIILYFINLPFSIFFLILTIFVIFFFRNPNRYIQKNDNNLLSPADGKVMEISEIYEDTFLKGKAIKVSIFLSLFNVHVNKAPMDGTVAYTHYRPGKYLPAFKPHCSDINEKNTIGIQNDKIKILVNQVTGFIARRIVCWVREGDSVTQGKNFGLIKFGSCTEIIVPENTKILVQKGQKVKGGITVIGVIENEV